MKKEITITNEIKEISRVAEFIDELGNTLNLSAADTSNLNLALEEAISNVIFYAYPEGQKNEITLTVSFEANELTFVITDKGKPFDPTKAKDADITLPAEDRSIGGLGIFLIKQIMNQVSYQRVGDENQLTMKKKIK